MSLFVAVRPDARATEDLQDAVDSARRQWTGPGLRWQPPSQWHLTLAFLGNPGEDVAFEVAERLHAVTNWPAVTGARIQGAGSFGGKVLWMGLEEGPARGALASMARDILRLLRGSGVTADFRPWQAHLTLARSRKGSATDMVDLLDRYSGPPWDVTELLLIRSTGGPKPAHHVAARYSLAGSLPSDDSSR
jgi:2'-5' RNA ligase